jgi:hypothetical protein
MLPSLSDSFIFNTGAGIVAAAATKDAGSATVIEAEAGAEREKERRTRSATGNVKEKKIVTGTGAETASARASPVDRHPQTSLRRQSLRPPPLLKVRSLPRGERSCGLGPLSIRYVYFGSSLMCMFYVLS